jgi:hypothetical protein
MPLMEMRNIRKDYHPGETVVPALRGIDLAFRWTQGLNDGSGQPTSILGNSLGVHIELFRSGPSWSKSGIESSPAF